MNQEMNRVFLRIQIEAGVPFIPFLRPNKTFWILQIAGRAAAKYDKIASYIAAAIPLKSWRKTARMILTTKTRPHHQRLHCSYFSIPYFLGSLHFSMEKWTKKWTSVFLRIQIEAYFHFFGTWKLFRRDYLDYLKLLAKSGDNLVF